MSADVLNLRLARKRRERLAREEAAARNRLSFGGTKAARKEQRLSAEKAARDLEAHRREPAIGHPDPAKHAELPEGGSGPGEEGH